MGLGLRGNRTQQSTCSVALLVGVGIFSLWVAAFEALKP